MYIIRNIHRKTLQEEKITELSLPFATFEYYAENKSMVIKFNRVFGFSGVSRPWNDILAICGR